MPKVGIITFHRSYNCGSMLESYAIHFYLKKMGIENEIIDFSNTGQRRLYSVFFECNSIKNIVKNILLLPHRRRIAQNNFKYEEFKEKYFEMSEEFSEMKQLHDTEYEVIIAGSDQIWNITIQDGDDAYFLPWVCKAKKVAYAPSFGARNISVWAKDVDKYRKWLKDFAALSVREQNGAKWIWELTGEKVDVLPDPTLLLDKEEYEHLLDSSFINHKKYIFFYCPSFQEEICRMVKKISDKYEMNVIAWSTKAYYIRMIYRYGFRLPEYESPSVYLSLIKGAELVVTTSFHGTIFSTIFRKKFYVIKSGGMYGDDDRVKTLLQSIKMTQRLVPCGYQNDYDYLQPIDYGTYERELYKLRQKAYSYIFKNIVEYCNARGCHNEKNK